MAKSTVVSIASIIPSFNTSAKSIVAAQRKADAIASKTGDAIAQAMQQHLDACAVAGLARDLPSVTALGKSIRECQVFLDAVAVGSFEKKTITEYAQGAMRAYFHNVPFTASLKNDPAFKIPAKDGSIKSGGAVSRTTREALFKTLTKALEQMRILEEHDAAAACLDTILEYFDGFTETETTTV